MKSLQPICIAFVLTILPLSAALLGADTDNAAHYNDLKQAFLHLELDERELRVREFATSDAWKTGAWTPQIWRLPLRA